MHGREGSEESASHALLAAALGGLLCVAASSGCSSGTSSPPASSQSSSAGASSSGASASSSGSVVTSAPFECDGGVSPDPAVTSSVMEAMTMDEFTTECAAQNGIFEIQPECGGQNLCRGMSYDTTRSIFTQHSCRGTNTCAGYTCIICD